MTGKQNCVLERKACLGVRPPPNHSLPLPPAACAFSHLGSRGAWGGWGGHPVLGRVLQNKPSRGQQAPSPSEGGSRSAGEERTRRVDDRVGGSMPSSLRPQPGPQPCPPVPSASALLPPSLRCKHLQPAAASGALLSPAVADVAAIAGQRSRSPDAPPRVVMATAAELPLPPCIRQEVQPQPVVPTLLVISV